MGTSRTARYEVRLAEDEREIWAAQALRYRVFYDEMGALPSREMARLQRDFDNFDDICDHLLVIDHKKSNSAPWIVGTYRMLRKDVAQSNFGFYTEQEFNLGGLLTYPGQTVEVGRSCVESGSRTGIVIQLLWTGIAEYISRHSIQLLFGCASFSGTKSDTLAPALSYLYRNHLAPEGLRPRARDDLYLDMQQDPSDGSVTMDDLPPLIKGYLRLGAYVGDGAVIDCQFNTTDICIIFETDRLTEKYRRHYQVAE